MTNLRSFAKTAFAIAALGATFAFAQQTQDGTATVKSEYVFTLDSAALAFSPTTKLASEDTDTLLFETNDGLNYQITVEAVADTSGNVWTFTHPTDTMNKGNEFPVLSVKAATANGGTALGFTTPAPLTTKLNKANAAVEVVNSINTVSGDATVTLETTIDHAVMAGSYAAKLTYSFVSY